MFKLEIVTENAAFGDDPGERVMEIARILRALADTMEAQREGYRMGNLRDANGNVVGHWLQGE